jgi:predicted RNase H-like nuclease (RuvC/YqgF family)
MKFNTKVSLLLLALALLLGAANAQSLGEAARQVRKKKAPPSPAQKVYTNENLPTNAPISIMAGSGADTTSNEKKGDAASKSETQSAASADSKKDQEEWRTRIAGQKDKIQALERELDVLQREHQIQVAVYYADAGTRLRDDRRWADQERQFKSDVETRQKQLADAKQQLEDLREQARKAGMPASVAD